jgi:hypothetical protein
MLRLQMGCWLVAWGLLSCGESSNRVAASTGGSAGEGASGGSAANSTSGASAGGSAAGGTSEDAPYFEPGSRLKPRVLALDDGVDVLLGAVIDNSWYDAELEFDCLFLPDEAGVERCFPRRFLSRSTYADADCTRRVLLDSAADSCSASRSPYVALEGDGCAYRGFRVGKELPQSTPLFYSADGTSCQVSLQTEATPMYEIEEVPAETFVGMQRSQRARAPGLDAHVREGDDGSWQVMGYFDPVREAACFDTFIGFEPLSKCVPAHASSSWFADSTCQTRIASVQQSSCYVEQRTAIIEAQVDVDSCPTTRSFELYEIEAVRETLRYEVDDSGACVASTLLAEESYIQGEAIDASTLPTLETLVVGTGAIRALFSGFGGVPYVPIGYGHTGLLDESGEACLPFHFPDGSLRCVPTSFSHATPAALVYEDASCDGPPLVAWIPKPTCPADPPLPRGTLFVDQSGCELAVTELRAVVGQSTASLFYARDAASGACAAITTSSPPPTYLQLGEILEATTFPALKATIRQ